LFECDFINKFNFIFKNHGELIRSFDGIFYFILNTLSTDNIDLLAVTLAIIAEIVKDKDNLQILTDLGIVSKISKLNNLVEFFHETKNLQRFSRIG
jgi:hypothetical protein